MATLYAAHGAQNMDDQWCDANDGVQDTAAQCWDDLVIDNAAAAVVFNTDCDSNSILITDGSLTLDGDRTLHGDVRLNGGVLADGGFDLSVVGDVLYTSGTYTGTGSITLTNDGNLSWNIYNQGIYHLIQENGVTTTLTGTVYYSKTTLGNGVIAGAQQFILRSPLADNAFVQDPAHTLGCASLIVQMGANYSNGAVYGSSLSADLQLQTTDATFTFTGDVNLGTANLRLRDRVNGGVSTLNMNGKSLTVGGIFVGMAGAFDRSGHLDLSTGSHKITGAVISGNAANLGNAIDYGSSYVELTGGSINGSNITASCDAGACHIQGGTLSNGADPSGAVHCHGTTDGGGNNADYTFDEHAPVGTMALMGVGI